MRIDLPPTGTGETPHFADLQSCQDWIKGLPLLNPTLAQGQLLEQLRVLNGYTMAARVRLDMLEALQTPVRFVQGECANLFSGKPLPLAPVEQTAIVTTHALWQELLLGYLRCLEALLGGDMALKPRAALVCQRALAILTDDFADLVRAGRQADTPLWRFAHALYSSAETLGVAQTPVADPFREALAATAVTDTLRGPRPVMPATTYVELVLIASASLHELAPRQQRWVMGWARRWATKVVIQAAPPTLTAALPLCVDLEGDAPPGFMPHTGTGARWLETGALRKSMKKRLVLLARGDPAVTPASLGLGEDCTQPSGGEVLARIYPRWVKGGVQRRYERHPMSGQCRFVAGVDAVHYYVSGHQPFRPPGSTSSDELRRQREELAMFGRVATRFEDEISRDQGFQLENWTLVEDWGLFDQSEDGLCLLRPVDREGGRLGIGQLVAVQPAKRSEMLLGVVRWTQQRGDNLVTGIQLMPGRPQPIAVRRTGVMATPDKYQPGFILPAIAALQMPDSLVMPPGGFRSERIMETWTQIATRRFKLKALLERGADFERASCVEIA
jgi:cyclic-di-GMP-binding protein